MATKLDIIERIADRTGTAKAQIGDFLNALIDVIAEEISTQSDCRIRGFGTIAPVVSRKRIGVNPQTRERMKVPQKVRVRFRPGKKLTRAAAVATARNGLKDLASLMVSELLLYNSGDIDEGIRDGNLEARLGRKLTDARESFASRVPEGLEGESDLFESTFQELIAKRARAIEAIKQM